MKLDKAIENIKQVLSRGGLWDNERMGLQLGIEALERVKRDRTYSNSIVMPEPLPSEKEKME